MESIICVGSLNVDIILYVDEFCNKDEDRIIKNIKVFSGGSAANIASGLGRLKKKAYFFGNLGNDGYTEMLMRDFDNDNVDYDFAVKTDKANNSCYSIVDKSGNRIMYAYNNVELTINDFPYELFENSAFVVFTSLIKEGIIDLYVEIAKKAKEKNVKVCLDPGNIFAMLGFDKLRPLLELCDYIFPSLSEVNLLIGGLENIKKLTDIIPNAIVTCGKDGAKYYSRTGMVEFKAKEVNSIDSTGAGDCFVAGFLAAMIDGNPEEDAIKFAGDVAALSTTKEGARSMPTLREIAELDNGQNI